MIKKAQGLLRGAPLGWQVFADIKEERKGNNKG